MAVRILRSEDNEQCLYDSVTMTAFGPVHTNQDYDLEDFLKWLDQDARKYTDEELYNQYYQWMHTKEMLDLESL